jgi:hypothetical protein
MPPLQRAASQLAAHALASERVEADPDVAWLVADCRVEADQRLVNEYVWVALAVQARFGCQEPREWPKGSDESMVGVGVACASLR